MLPLHTWTLDTTPLAEVLRVARRVGWDGIELRRVDFARAAEQGQSAADVLALVRTSGLPVACVGVELGWMYAEGAERRRLLQVFDERCQRAAALGCVTVMSPVDKGHGDLRRAAESVREVGEAAGYRGFMSYEAPTPAAWARPADDVAREALEATRAVLPR